MKKIIPRAVKIKVDLVAAGSGCVPSGGGSDVKQFDSRLTCYEPSGAYAPCGGAGTIPFTSDATQCVVLGTYAARPGSPLIATDGTYLQ